MEQDVRSSILQMAKGAIQERVDYEVSRIHEKRKGRAKMSKLDLDSFGEIMDQFLKDNEIQMLLTMEKGTLDVSVEDNVLLGSVVRFYILLRAINYICDSMRKDMGIDGKSTEWAEVVDVLLQMVKEEMLGGGADE